MQGIGTGQGTQVAHIQTAAQGQVLGAGKGRFGALGADALRHRFFQAAHHAEAQPYGWCLQSAIPIAVHHVHRAHLHAVALRVLHQLGRAIKAQRLAVEHGGQKAGRLMPFEPAAHIHQERKAGGVALGETVFTKAFDLFEYLVGIFLRVAVFEHAANQAVMELAHPTLALPGGHGAAQLVGLARRKIGSSHGNLHHLLLKNRYAQGALQSFLQLGTGVLHRLRVGACLEVGVHHAALNRAGPHDGYLHYQVVKAAGLQARQHAHLRAALNLEYPHGVGLADHGVGGGVFGGNVLDAHRRAAPLADELQAAANGAEHAQGQHVHLEQTHCVQVVLVPLDDRAVRHGRVFYRHQAGERALGEHKTADVLAQVAGEALQLAGQIQPELQAAGRGR